MNKLCKAPGISRYRYALSKVFVLYFFSLLHTGAILAQDAISASGLTYFNSLNKPCGEENSTWFSTPPQKKGDHYYFTGYFPTGEKYVEGAYSSLDSGGIRDGFFQYYEKNGALSSEGNIRQRKLQGTWKHYYNDGKSIWHTVDYNGNGFRTGLTSYYPGGAVKRKEVYTLTSEMRELISGTCYDKEGNEIEFTQFEQLPVFPGGNDAISSFLGEKIVYPPKCRKNNIQGRVILRFRVETDGYIQDIQVLRSAHPDLDAEAVRVISQMPSWQPGKQDDTAAAVYFSIPITFRLK